jgi:hypothetical protein
MATSSVLTQEQMSLVKPANGVMIERGEGNSNGFDREAIRTEFAPIRELANGTRYVEEGSATFLHTESDYPDAPTSVGESFGNVELVREVGGTQYIPRYTHGFTYDTEDGEVDDSFLAEMRDGILQMFDVQADYAFLQGMDDEAGNSVFDGVFQFLEDNMPSSNFIDCSNYDPSAGDLAGVPANIVLQEAYQKVTGHYVETQWDIAVAKHPIWSEWNQVGTFDGAILQSQWEVMQATDDAEVGVNRRLLLPNEIGLPTAPSQNGNLTFDIDYPARTNTGYTSDIGTLSDFEEADDVMYLIPEHGGDFYELYEEGTPDTRGPLEKDGFRERFEYKWRGGVVQGQNMQKRDTNVALDTIKLENVTALFD